MKKNNLISIPRRSGSFQYDCLSAELAPVELKTNPEIIEKHEPAVIDPAVLRPLGSFEEFFWLLDQNRPAHFALAARVKGTTRIRQWRRALDLVQQRHPLLSVCIQKNGNSHPEFLLEIAAPIPLRLIQENNATQRWEFEMESELSFAFNPERAPLVRAVLLHEANQAVIILVAHHSIADGLSIAFVIRDLLQTLSGERIGMLPTLPSHEEIMGLPGAALLARPGGDQPPAATPAARPARYIRRENLRPHIRETRLTPAVTTKLRERAREERTTVHGALSAALALASWQNKPDLKGSPIRICSPIDTRKLLGLGEDCAALVDAGIATLEPRTAADFWDIARESMASLAAAQTLEGVIASRNVIYQAINNGVDVPAAAAICAQGFAHELMLTNLGSLPYGTDFGHLRLDSIWGPAVSARFEGAPTIGVATTNGSLCLLETNFSVPGSLLKTTEEVLLSACAS